MKSRGSRSVLQRLADAVEYGGATLILLLESLGGAVTPAHFGRAFRRMMDQLYVQLVKSMGVVTIVGVFIGMILAIQSGEELRQFGAEDRLAFIVAGSMAREMGPFVTSVILAATVGAAIAAELGTMRVSEEIDALEVMSIDPARFLVMPRIVAMAIMTPLLTVFSDAVAIIGGGIISLTQLNVSWPKYYQNVLEGLSVKGIWTGLGKALIFGLVIAIVSCSEGLRTTGGAVGVGRATRRSVIVCYLLILILGYFVTAVFYGKGGQL